MQAVAEASTYLPTYEAQQLQACIKVLREDLLLLRAQCEPKKRFSFARKATLAQAEPASLPICRQDGDRLNAETGMVQTSDMVQHQARGQDRQVVPEGNLHTGTNGSSAATPRDIGSALSGRCCTHSPIRSFTFMGLGNTAEWSGFMHSAYALHVGLVCGSCQWVQRCSRGLSIACPCRRISGKQGESIEYAVQGEGGPLTISDLVSCTVCVKGKLEALRLIGLQDCTVLAGPVHGAAFVQGA